MGTMKYRQQEEELRRRQEENRLFMQERAEAMKDNYQDNYLSGGYQTGSYQQAQRRGDGYSQGGSSWRSGGGENWGRGVTSAQSHSPAQYENDYDRDYQVQTQERMGYTRGGSQGTSNSLAEVANDNELQPTDLRK